MKAKLSKTRYTVVSDSVDRVLRVFMTTENSRVIHLRATLKGPTDVLLSELLSGLREERFDVLGSRLRFGLRQNATGAERERWRTLDIFLRLTDDLRCLTFAQLDGVVDNVSRSVSQKTRYETTVKITRDPEQDESSANSAVT